MKPAHIRVAAAKRSGKRRRDRVERTRLLEQIRATQIYKDTPIKNRVAWELKMGFIPIPELRDTVTRMQSFDRNHRMGRISFQPGSWKVS